MASACVDAPTAFQALNFPPRQVCLKTSPTFFSSDLFTPFSASPPSSITEFVRPSYGKGNTWGVVKTSYAGVGHAVGMVEESGRGSISRSHRHYGTGCVNYHAPNQPYSVTELQLSQCRPCDQLLPKPLLTQEVVLRKQKEEFPRNGAFTSHVSKFAVFPCATTKDGSSASSKEVLTPKTVETLQQLHSALYCTTNYKQQHRNFFTKKLEDLHRTVPAQNHKERFSVEKTNSFHVFDAGAASDGDGAHGRGEEDSTPAAEVEGAREGNTGPELDAELGDIEEHYLPDEINEYEEKQGNGGAHESDFATDRDPSSYIRVTHLKELPDHFGRITSKYTRNYRCSTWPCYIPYYLHHRHSLLPSSIAVLPPEFCRTRPPSVCKGKDRPGSSKTEICADVASDDSETSSTKIGSSANNTSKFQSALRFNHGSQNTMLPVNVPACSSKEQKLPSLTHTQSGVCTQAQGVGLHSNSTTHLHGQQSPTTTSYQDWRLPKIVNSGAPEGDGMECVEVPPLSHRLSPSGSRVPHRLGLRFKSEAHARYHVLYPDSVPDLRDSRQSAKKHFFFGYHASVFRG